MHVDDLPEPMDFELVMTTVTERDPRWEGVYAEIVDENSIYKLKRLNIFIDDELVMSQVVDARDFRYLMIDGFSWWWNRMVAMADVTLTNRGNYRI